MTTTTRNPLADTIASNIKAELDRLGWGYDDLARAVDLPIERVSEWQAAATSMELNELAAVAQALGLTASSLTIGPGIDPRAQCPCPSWCGHKAGHEYETISLAGEPARDHTRHVSDLGGHSVSVTAGALLTEAGEKVERPVVDLWLGATKSRGQMARLGNDASQTVWSVSGVSSWTFDKAPKDVRDKKVWDLSRDNVTGIELKDAKGEFVFTKNETAAADAGATDAGSSPAWSGTLNGKPIAKGEIVAQGNRFGLRIVELAGAKADPILPESGAL